MFPTGNTSVLPGSPVALNQHTDQIDFSNENSSARVLGLERKIPSMADVFITEFCFSTPRIIMQRCLASMMTATSSTSVAVFIARAISMVRSSWFCNRRAYISTILATLDRPMTNLFRNVSHVTFADKRQQMMFAKRIEFDILDDDHLAPFRRKAGFVDYLFQVLRVTSGQKTHCPRRALRRVFLIQAGQGCRFL